MQIAVIGSGAAAVGAIQGLAGRVPGYAVTVIDIGADLDHHLAKAAPPDEWSYDDHRALYRAIRADHGLRFPPPKTHFGQGLPRYEVAGRPRFIRSELYGGLTNFWGGTMLPYPDVDLRGFPVDAAGMDPYYAEIAELVGIAGRRDRLNEYFPREYANRPPLQPIPALARLDDVVNSSDGGTQRGDYRVISGVSRITLETRAGNPRECTYCGQCMSGCYRDSVYSARHTMDAFREQKRFDRYIRGKVARFEAQGGKVTLHTQDGETYNGFDKVFLAAGAPGTTEIVMRSLGVREGPVLQDNAVYCFPILYMGRGLLRDPRDRYLALNNLLLGVIPRDPAGGKRFVQVQIYANFDYLWRYYVSPRFWAWFAPLAQFFRGRVFWTRMYVHSEESPAYAPRIAGDGQLRYEFARRDGKEEHIAAIMRSVRGAVNRCGFYIPPARPMRQKTSSHYAATFPYGGGAVPVERTGRVAPGVYIVDSAAFPDGSAVSPTFTIMANACRSAREAMDD